MAHNTQNPAIVARRTRLYRGAVGLVLIPVVTYLCYALSALFMPVLFGAILAYLSYPATFWLQRKGLNKSMSVFLYVSFFLLSLFMLLNTVRSQLPEPGDQIQLKVTAQYKLNQHYQSFMMPEDQPGQSFLRQLILHETHAIMDKLNQYLLLDEAEQDRLAQLLDSGESDIALRQQQRLQTYQEENERLISYTTGETLQSYAAQEDQTDTSLNETVQNAQGTLSLLVNAFSTWMIMPFVFFFLLLDDGKLKKKLISKVPNIFFEMTLTSVNNVDKAIGGYLRGSFTESLTIFILFMILLPLIGFSLGASLLIGLFAALTNIIPVFGPVAGGIACVGYALITEDISSPLSLIDDKNITVSALLIVIFIQIIDNIILKPYILGSATDVHPVTVVFLVIAGGILLGFWGVLFSIPFWVILKVSALTVHQRLKLYGIIKA